MRKLILTVIFFATVLITSCINFGVLSHTTESSSLSPRELSLSFGNYTRDLFVNVRKGIYKDDFFGAEIGGTVFYALPDENFDSLSSSLEFKVSGFESSKTGFATGLGVNYLFLRKKENGQDIYINPLYVILPLYMSSSLTEWFEFILNFRFLCNVYFPEGQYPQNILSYKENLITVNAGVELFEVFILEGYLLAGKNLNSFPIPGISIHYKLNL